MTLFNSLMGPLGKEYCILFYGVGVFIFLLMLVSIFAGILSIFNSKDKSTKLVGVATIVNALTLLFMYLLYRMLYNICLKVL